MEPDFGIFEPVFESAHGYLALLNLSAEDARAAVDLVRNCCRKVANPHPDICNLLENPNWRPHLVAAVAMIVSDHDAQTLRGLWRRLDTGSWVTPQIGVALFLSDPEFPVQSRTRLEGGCPIDASDLLSMTGPEHNSAGHTAGTGERSAKAAATLLYLLQIASPVPDWVKHVRDSEEMRVLLAQDIDASQTIADRWLHRIRELTGRAK